ncbi:hypothetical protein Tco_1057488 [Tanacetum coccineum]|uniref:Reverse transcriptase domain-containing protein n=1 Tax=Tanacetum coccineum TaxID=301880 RepID=A0ABQ5H5S0_9ASTR
MLVEMIAERNKFFVAQRAAEQRRKPPTKNQIRNRICTYLKNMGGYKHNQLKGRSYEEIQKLFDKAYKQVSSFVPMDSKEVKRSVTRIEGSSKRAGDELESDKSKKQKIDEHVIVEYKIDKDGRMGYFKLIRADGSSKWYSSMIKMLQDIDREDLETPWKLVKAKHENTRPEEDYERVLWGDLKSPSEHPKEKYNLDPATKLARAKPNKRSGDADVSKDKSGPESPLEFWRSWYVEGHIRSGVISFVLMHRCQRTIRQRHSPCEGPLSLEGHVANKLYQESALRLWSSDKGRRNRNPWGAYRTSQRKKNPSPSPASIKENIDVLLTMIKEHDQQAKMKVTPRKLSYADSDKEAPAGSLDKGFSDRFSLESSGTSDTRRQTRSTIKSQKTPSKNKEPTHLRRSRRLEDRSTTREKARRERSKSRRKRSGHQETSSDFEYEEGLDDACEDLNSPYKRPKPTLFTQRITHFKYHKRAKLPRNIKVYEGNKDPDDHLGIFSVAAEQEEWLMPIWCKMFWQTLGGAARSWFDDLDPKSVDSFEELSQKFLEEFSQQKIYAKDPTEIHGIKRR